MARIHRTLRERILAKIMPVTESGCWIWTGALNNAGYGTIQVSTKNSALAHRVTYELFKGPIPAALYLDHLCRVKCCVNPAHLEPVTNAENVRRGVGSGDAWTKAAAEKRLAIRICPKGHPYDDANTYHNPNQRRRQCRTCARDRAERNRRAAKMPVRQFRQQSLL